jgi:hypothetical protein
VMCAIAGVVRLRPTTCMGVGVGVGPDVVRVEVEWLSINTE